MYEAMIKFGAAEAFLKSRNGLRLELLKLVYAVYKEQNKW